MAGAFQDALDQLDQIFAAGIFEIDVCRTAFHALGKAYVPRLSAVDLRRMVAHCLHALGQGDGRSPCCR